MTTIIHQTRRDQLLKAVPDALILILGAQRFALNIPMNAARFRQNSHFLYFCGLSAPNAALLGDPETGRWTLFRPLPPPGDEIWHGETLIPEIQGKNLGVDGVFDINKLHEYVNTLKGNRPLYAPPASDAHSLELLQQLGADRPALQGKVTPEHDTPLLQAIIALRNLKEPEEVEEMAKVGSLSSDVHRTLMAATCPGVTEAHLRALTEGMFTSAGCRPAYNPIITNRGDILHARAGNTQLKGGDLLLVDVGAETPNGYAADITRTFPVSGRFSQQQRDIYSIVLECNEKAIDAARLGVGYRDLHLKACVWLAEGLRDLGILKDTPENCVETDAHALFFPHGLGHLLGLDVHDLEDIGDLAGYEGNHPRSERFGLAWLRMTRILKAGMVVTIEPGLYFIDALLQDPVLEAKYRSQVDFDKARTYLGMGGVRIEDNILIQGGAPLVFSNGCPKDIDSIEALVGSQKDALGAFGRLLPFHS